MLEAKAQRFAKELGYENFMGSDVWFDRCKKRREIYFRVLSGESAAIPQGIVDNWVNNSLSKLLADYNPSSLSVKID